MVILRNIYVIPCYPQYRFSVRSSRHSALIIYIMLYVHICGLKQLGKVVCSFCNINKNLNYCAQYSKVNRKLNFKSPNSSQWFCKFKVGPIHVNIFFIPTDLQFWSKWLKTHPNPKFLKWKVWSLINLNPRSVSSFLNTRSKQHFGTVQRLCCVSSV